MHFPRFPRHKLSVGESLVAVVQSFKSTNAEQVQPKWFPLVLSLFPCTGNESCLICSTSVPFTQQLAHWEIGSGSSTQKVVDEPGSSSLANGLKHPCWLNLNILSESINTRNVSVLITCRSRPKPFNRKFSLVFQTDLPKQRIFADRIRITQLFDPWSISEACTDNVSTRYYSIHKPDSVTHSICYVDGPDSGLLNSLSSKK